jgi:AcrR family transcriptional regulator
MLPVTRVTGIDVCQNYSVARTITKRARTGVYGGVSAEQRRADRRRRLMDAALEIIGTEGWSQTTTRGVCERARVGPRFFYESFDDLDALAVAVLDEIIEEALAKVFAAIAAAPDDLPSKTRAAVETFIGEVTDDPRRARFLFAEAHGSEALVNRRFEGIRNIAAVVVTLAHGLLELPPGSERFTRATALMITGGIAEMVLVWNEGDLDITKDELIDLSVELMLTAADSAPGILDRLSYN